MAAQASDPSASTWSVEGWAMGTHHRRRHFTSSSFAMLIRRRRGTVGHSAESADLAVKRRVALVDAECTTRSQAGKGGPPSSLAEAAIAPNRTRAGSSPTVAMPRPRRRGPDARCPVTARSDVQGTPVEAAAPRVGRRCRCRTERRQRGRLGSTPVSRPRRTRRRGVRSGPVESRCATSQYLAGKVQERGAELPGCRAGADAASSPGR